MGCAVEGRSARQSLRGAHQALSYTAPLVLLVATLASIAITPLVIRVAVARRLYDTPDTRRLHTKPIPRLGGVVVFVATLLGLVAALFLVTRGGFCRRTGLSSLRASCSAVRCSLRPACSMTFGDFDPRPSWWSSASRPSSCIGTGSRSS